MRTVQDVRDLIEEYKKDYPDLKAQVSIEALEALEALHGPGALDECYAMIEKQFDGEIAVKELVKLGVSYPDAVKQVFGLEKAGEDAQV